MPALFMEPFDCATSAMKARLVCPFASAFAAAFTMVPARVHADRPLEVELAAVGLGACDDNAVSIARWISSHAHLVIAVDVPGRPKAAYEIPLSARPSHGGGWMARALIRPAAWANADSVTVVSLVFAGRPLPCDCLPATLPAGYNHAPAPAGAVMSAAKAGDAKALEAALEAGGSTEEADTVRGEEEEEEGGAAPFPSSLRPPTAIERLEFLSLGRRRRPPRDPPHTSCGRRKPGREKQGEKGEWGILSRLHTSPAPAG